MSEFRWLYFGIFGSYVGAFLQLWDGSFPRAAVKGRAHGRSKYDGVVT